MADVDVRELQVLDRSGGVKKFHVHVQTQTEIDCDCNDVSVKVYWHAESAGGTITTPSGTVSKGDVTNPQGVLWTWTAGDDGWITDSTDINPEWNRHVCEPSQNGNRVIIADGPGIGIPPGSQGNGYTYNFQVTYKIDFLCNGHVVDYAYFQLTITGQGGPNGPAGTRTFKKGQDALDDINQKMRDKGGYTVDAEGKSW